jgi:antitoxin CptB
MSGTTLSSQGLDERRRRILWRAWHRGTKEMDLVMGRFADAALGSMADAEVTEFERLMDVPDPDLFAWIIGREAVPATYDGPLFRRLKLHHCG